MSTQQLMLNGFKSKILLMSWHENGKTVLKDKSLDEMFAPIYDMDKFDGMRD